MAEITRYVIVDEHDSEEDFEFDTMDEAVQAAQKRGGNLAVIERIYTYDDCSLVWASTGDDTWPPPADFES